MKNLIIRTSSSKLPDGEIKSNFGDLLRTTVILNCIKGDYLWITDEKAIRLLKFFIPSEKLMIFNDFSNFDEEFEIYNLDNYVFDWNAFNKLKGNWHGFILKNKNLVPENKKIKSTEAYNKTKSEISWQRNLIEGLGFKWQEQDYTFLLTKLREPAFDIGLNYKVHPEWNSKKWPEKYWQELKYILEKDFSVSFQQGLEDFDEYINWLNSCRLIITCDTLGLHLASALRKNVIAIVGPTTNQEFDYKRVKFLRPKSRECMPCNSKECRYEKSCLDEITPESVEKEVIKLIGK